MSTEHDVAHSLRSWLRENRHEDANRVLDAVLTEVDATPQRRAGWLARRIPLMKNAFRFAVVAAAVVVVAVIGYQSLPSSGTGGPVATPTPTPTPSATPTATAQPLAIGSFTSHGGQIELDATGDGADVTGTMTYTNVEGADLGGFVVDLACTRTTDGGWVLIGGPIIDSTNRYVESAPVGSNIALVLQRGSPVKAEIYGEHPDPHEASCPVFLESIESIPDLGDPGSLSGYWRWQGLEALHQINDLEPISLEPIEGTIELRP